MAVDPYDEEEIKADDLIIRRINRDQQVVWDDNRGSFRISTKAFTPSSTLNGGMSVDIEAKIVFDGIDPKEYVTTPVFTGSVAFPASAARELNLLVGYDPLTTNAYHGEVWGSKRPNRFNKSQKNGLLQASAWYVELEGVQIP